MSRKSRKELEEKLAIKEAQVQKLQERIDKFTEIFKQMSELEDSAPSDCKKGLWCTTCQFTKGFLNTKTNDMVYICAKGECCGHYVPREV